MDNDFQSKLKNVLSDPDAMSKITAIASSLGMGDTSDTHAKENLVSEPASSVSEPEPNPLGALSALSQPSDPRLQLLYSVKPLLREDKRQKIDSLTRALTVASMMKNFRK